MRCHRSAVYVILTTLLMLVPVLTLPAWDWPLDGAFATEPGRYIEGFSYRLVPSGASPAAFRPVEQGELVFWGPANNEDMLITSAIPRPVGISVYAHGNGIVSGYFGPELSANKRSDEGTVEQVVSWLEFVIWDLFTENQANPRLLLSRRDGIAASTIPQVRFRQNGQYVAASGITTGMVTVVIDTETVSPTQLPWELRVLRGGVVRSYRRFAYSNDLANGAEGESFIVLDSFEANPGINTFVLEALRFDRSTVRRTIRITAREPVIEDGS